MLHHRWRSTVVPALCLVFLFAPLPAAASLVSVTAGFTSFSGAVGSDGQFETLINGNVVCPDAGCDTGIGVANIAFAQPYSNGVEFQNSSFGTPALFNEIYFSSAPEQDVVLGQRFLLGTLTYENGTWFSDPEFGVELTSHSPDPAFDGFVWSDTLHLSITTNQPSNTPYQNADFLYFVDNPGLGSVRAFELSDSPNGSNVVTIEVYGTINSLHVLELSNATGGGFWDPSVDLQPSVPEPAAIELLLGGAAALGWLRRRRTT